MHSELHTILFKKDKYNINSIVDFLYNHQFKPIKKIDSTRNIHFYRTRIRDPKLFKKFTTKKILNGDVELVFGWR
jgi:hypothetical protein